MSLLNKRQSISSIGRVWSASTKVDGWSLVHLNQICYLLNAFTDLNSVTYDQWTKCSVQAAIMIKTARGANHAYVNASSCHGPS